MLDNSLVKGWVRHRRYAPKPHQFDYDMDWTLLDLDSIEEQFSLSRLWSIETFNIISYRAKDFHCGVSGDADLAQKKQPASNKSAIIQSIKEKLDKDFNGKVFMLSHLRNYGYNFNSVCFYFCYENGHLSYLITEITNTPWSERHSYIFDCQKRKFVNSDVYQFEFNKEFHVSPFIQMDMRYRWTFKVNEHGVRVHMVVLGDDSKKYFDATFTGDFLPLTKRQMNRFAWLYAFQPLKMSFLIYWQAFKLWLKRLTVYDHPKHSNQRSSK